MTALVTQRVHQLADTLAELKVKVRTALATELASAVGTAVRDVLIVAVLDRLVRPIPTRSPRSSPYSRDWRANEPERDRWDDSRDPWDADDDDSSPVSFGRDSAGGAGTPAVPAASALAVGVTVGRWWLARRGTVASAFGVGALASALGLAGGPIARAILAVLTATSDVLTAESALTDSAHS